MIHELVDNYILESWEDTTWLERHKGKIAVSEIGHCPRKAMLRLHEVPITDDYDMFEKRRMWSGTMAEIKMETVLKAKYPKSFQKQVHLENESFIGTVDFIIEPAIVEHKETATSNFRYNRLPYEFHLIQVMSYKHLYGDEDLEAIIYYQNRADWAEFRVWENVGQILYEGKVNDKYKLGEIGTTVENEMEELLYWYKRNELAPRYKTPFEINFACTRMYSKNAYPSCTYFNHEGCWGNTKYAGQDKILIPENND